MSRLTKYVGLAVLVGAIAALTISSAVFAQTPTPPASTTRPAFGGGFGRGLCGQAGLDAAASALKMTSAELSAQLWGGNTLSALAAKAGIDIQTVQSAVQAACTQSIKNAIQQAVTSGRMTQAQADWLNEGLDKGYWGPQGGFGFGFGFGMGRGWGHGFGGFRGPKGANPNGTTPNGGTTSPSRFIF